MILTTLALGAVGLTLLVQVALIAYLLLLTVAALITRPTPPPATTTRRRFAILVPAHDEEAVIGRLLASLQELDYPRDCFDVCVVADNCTDTTAPVARACGALVYERADEQHRAKGFALEWLLGQLAAEHRTYDAFVIVDADSVLAPNFLLAMNARLAAGAEAVQAYYSVLNLDRSPVAGLRYAALAAVHYLRPLGRSRFGWSAGLKGNGMCFSAALIERFGWRWYSLTEDVEFHLALLAGGWRVEFAPETEVRADMPVTLNQASTQNQRWERGRLQLIRTHVPPLVRDGVRRRSGLKLDAAIEQLIPPLSLPFAASALALVAAALLGSWLLVGIALACLIGYTCYVLAALVLVRAPRYAYLALGLAPVYVAWKVSLYVRALVGPRRSAWVRTARSPSRATPN
jgi:cellulose synthase/poly-beta-1,6-N-acetylglucosamine synthase-like glycosyltransferase